MSNPTIAQYYIDILAQISPVCPVNGMVISNINDKTTWTVWYNPSANSSQIAAGQGVVNGYNVATLATTLTANTTRIATIAADSNYQNLINIINNSSAAQIDVWLANNVNNLAQALPVLGALIKFVAYTYQGGN